MLLLTERLLDDAAGRATTELALRVDRDRFEPVVCCYAGWGPLAEELDRAGIEIFPLRRRSGLDPTYVLALAHEIRRRRIDVVHSLHAAKAYVVGVLAGALSGVRVGVATFRDRPRMDSRHLRGAGRLCGEVVGSVVATSSEVAEALFRERWVPPGKTLVIPDGVSIQRFAAEGRRGPARALWGVPPEAPLVGAILQTDALHELELLRAAFERVRARRPDAWLVCCGVRGGDEQVLGLGPFTDSPALYAAIDVLCVPHASRVVPLTLIEGLAAGVPIAASRRGVDDGLAPAGPWAFANVTAPGADALASGILELVEDELAARALVREGSACVEADFSVAANVQRVQELYART